jgi:multidrug resistance efflux pump
MLNISPQSGEVYVPKEKYGSLQEVERPATKRLFLKLFGIFFGIFFVVLFLPWTQNVQSRGQVTTLSPNERPQTVNSVIAGRIEEWFVQEGEYVERGDTIMFISEVKDDYFDPQLIDNTERQLNAKEASVVSYASKVNALENQIAALQENLTLKLEQARNKLQQARLKTQSDSIEFEAAKVNTEIARQQLERMEQLYEEGLKSLTDLEKRRMDLQKAQADLLSKENKLLASQNDIINAKVELSAIRSEYQDKIAKAESDKFTALSSQYDTEVAVNKLQNTLQNYEVRQGFYYISAPQNGYITQAVQQGIGETIKEGDPVVTIMPADYTLAVAMYVEPINLPLIERGQEVRIQFDGWPAIVFSGWPNTSFGTFGGRVFAIDNFVSENGLYRVLVEPDESDHEWPDELRVGAGARTMSLLKTVPVGYELWRQINGFPPDYYKPLNEGNTKDDKEKKK